MKATKFMKGSLAAALAVTMAVTPAASVKAAEVTVTSGPSTYIFTEMPIAAFEVTGLGVDPYSYTMDDRVALSDNTFILYCVPGESTFVNSGSGSSPWVSNFYWNMWDNTAEGTIEYIECNASYFEDPFYAMTENDDTQYYGMIDPENIEFVEIFHADAPQKDALYVIDIYDGDDIAWIQQIFGRVGVNAVPISVEDALARGNASVQSDAAADAAAQAASQTQVTQQQTSVSQGTYVVEANDNLSRIAQKVYGDNKAWRVIYNANSNVIKSDYIIYKGQVLVIPAR